MPYDKNKPYNLNNLNERLKIQGITDGYLQRKTPNDPVKLTPRGAASGFYEASAKKKKRKNDIA